MKPFSIILFVFFTLTITAQDYNYDIPHSVVYLKTSGSYKTVELIPLWPANAKQLSFNHKEDEWCHDQTECVNEFGRDRWVKFVEFPMMYVFKSNTGKASPAVVIYPGGGGKWVSIDREGFNVARELAQNGITAIVVKYRTKEKRHWDKKPNKAIFKNYKAIAGDIKQSFNLAYKNADAWCIDTAKLGIMGFSAGCWHATQLAFNDAVVPELKGGILSVPKHACLAYGDMNAAKDFYSKSKNRNPIFLLTSEDDPHIEFGPYTTFLKKLKEDSNQVGHCFLKDAGHGFGYIKPNTKTNYWLKEYVRWLFNI